MQKEKKCKAIGKAIGFDSCAEFTYIHRFGLCRNCFIKWLQTTIEGKDYLSKNTIKAKLKPKKPKPKYHRRSMEEMPLNELVTYVQEKIVNPYIRERDETNFMTCISSGNQIHDAGHYHSRGGCISLRYSPQNIHGQNRSDNGYKGGNLIGYREGLIQRHGLAYFEQLEDLKAIYSSRSKWLDHETVLKIAKIYKYWHKHKIWRYLDSDLINAINN